MSARIPIGWTACVEGQKRTSAYLIEIMDQNGSRWISTCPMSVEWDESHLAYRVIEAERPPIQYPVEPVLTPREADHLVAVVYREMMSGPQWSKIEARRVSEIVGRLAREITREVGQ